MPSTDAPSGASIRHQRCRPMAKPNAVCWRLRPRRGAVLYGIDGRAAGCGAQGQELTSPASSIVSKSGGGGGILKHSNFRVFRWKRRYTHCLTHLREYSGLSAPRTPDFASEKASNFELEDREFESYGADQPGSNWALGFGHPSWLGTEQDRKVTASRLPAAMEVRTARF